MVFREVTLISIVIRILTAMLISGVLGLERERKSRAAGLRTYILVCVGSCLIMLTNQYIFQTTGMGDPMRLGAQVVSGIGFLGAGTIIVTRGSQIKGLTTAAGLWSSAAVGLALGAGFYEAAFAVGFTVFFVMTVLQRWDVSMHRKAKYMDIYLEYSSQIGLAPLLQRIRELELELDIDGIEAFPGGVADSSRALLLSLKFPKRTSHKEVLQKIQQVEGVLYTKEM